MVKTRTFIHSEILFSIRFTSESFFENETEWVVALWSNLFCKMSLKWISSVYHKDILLQNSFTQMHSILLIISLFVQQMQNQKFLLDSKRFFIVKLVSVPQTLALATSTKPLRFYHEKYDRASGNIGVCNQT